MVSSIVVVVTLLTMASQLCTLPFVDNGQPVVHTSIDAREANRSMAAETHYERFVAEDEYHAWVLAPRTAQAARCAVNASFQALLAPEKLTAVSAGVKATTPGHVGLEAAVGALTYLDSAQPCGANNDTRLPGGSKYS